MFRSSQILSIMPRIIKALEDYQALDSKKSELVQIIVNAIILLMEQGELEQAEKYISIAQSNLNNRNLGYEQIRLNFIKGCMLINNGEYLKGIEVAEKAIGAFQYLGWSNEVRIHQKHLDKLVR